MHGSFVFTSSTFRFGGTSCTKAAFSHLTLSVSEGRRAQKLCFHIFHSQILTEVSHESFVFTSSTFRFGGMSCSKASFSHLQRSDLEGRLARKLRFRIFHFQILREVSQETFVFTSSSLFEGSLARNLRFHIFITF